jgi:hypothetical protein
MARRHDLRLRTSVRQAIERQSGRGAADSMTHRVLVKTELIIFQVVARVVCSGEKRQRGALVAREQLDFERHMLEMNANKFECLYRLRKEFFNVLVLRLRPILQRRHSRPALRSPAIDTNICLAITMRLVAGASYLDVGWPYGIADSTVYTIFDPRGTRYRFGED